MSQSMGSLETGNQKYDFNYFQILTQASALVNSHNSLNNWCTTTIRNKKTCWYFLTEKVL